MNSLARLLLPLVLMSSASIHADARNKSFKKVTEVITQEAQKSSVFMQAIKGCIDDEWRAIEKINPKVLKSLKRRVVSRINSTLSHSEKKAVIGMLRRLKRLTDFSTQDLLDIVYASDTFKKRDAENESIAKAMGWTKETNPRELTEQQLQDEYQKMDALSLPDKTLTKSIHFFARAGMAGKDNEILALYMEKNPLYELFADVSQAIAVPYVIVNDFYYFPGFEKHVKVSGKKFKIINAACSALLADLEQ